MFKLVSVVTTRRTIVTTALRSMSVSLSSTASSDNSQFRNSFHFNWHYQKCYFSSNNSWNWSQSSSSTGASTNLTNPPANESDPETIAPSVQNQIMETCAELHSSIMPLNEKLIGPLAKSSDKGTSLPFVFLVGNHSSGKSSFINYVLGRDVQTAGVAPTDDCFTVVAPGPEDTDQDGPALIGDPDMGFSALRQFGPTLIHHTQLKVRKDTNSPSFMMIDSPGMIDSPVSQSGMPQGGGEVSMDRGYDFQGVVRWFAEKADVVLLFFDPDKILKVLKS